VTGFAEAFERARDVEGWLTEAQARRLWDSARAVPPGGVVVEIGSFRGRSALVMASALSDGAQLVAIDPHAGGHDMDVSGTDDGVKRSEHEAPGVGRCRDLPPDGPTADLDEKAGGGVVVDGGGQMLRGRGGGSCARTSWTPCGRSPPGSSPARPRIPIPARSRPAAPRRSTCCSAPSGSVRP